MEPRGKPLRPKQTPVQLMFNTHDPLAEVQRAGRVQEDEYFRTLEQELLVALREQDAVEIEQAIRHYTHMRCPKCGEPLEAMSSRQGTIETCPGCGGIWLDKGAWEGHVGLQTQGWLPRLFEGLLAVKQQKV